MVKSRGSPPPDIPTEAGGGGDESPISYPLHFPPSESFESEDEAKGSSASMAISETHHIERGTIAAVTSARKLKYSGKKRSDSNKNHRQPSHALKKQTVTPGKMVFVEKKVIKYRVKVDSLGYVIMLDHLKRYSMTQLHDNSLEQDRLRKRRERHGQSAHQIMEYNSQQQQVINARRECERSKGCTK
jgi:hypothetical protein